MRRTSLRALATAVLTLGVAAAPRVLLAQGDSGQAPADTSRPAATMQGGAQPVPSTAVPAWVNGHARALNLTPKQVDRVHKVQVWLTGQDSTLRGQWNQITGGRPFRAIPPAERRRLGPQLQPLQQQLRANNLAALDSVDAILTPAQQTKLQTMLAEYRQRARQRGQGGGQER